MAGGNRRRVRCRACGKSVTLGLSVCPNCGQNPARFHTRWKSTILSVIFGTALGLVVFPLVPHLETPHAVQTPPALPVLVAVARPTFTGTPTATAPPTPTATQTSTSTPTPTPTPTVAMSA